jgi:hypothetical protein
MFRSGEPKYIRTFNANLLQDGCRISLLIPSCIVNIDDRLFLLHFYSGRLLLLMPCCINANPTTGFFTTLPALHRCKLKTIVGSRSDFFLRPMLTHTPRTFCITAVLAAYAAIVVCFLSLVMPCYTVDASVVFDKR